MSFVVLVVTFVALTLGCPTTLWKLFPEFQGQNGVFLMSRSPSSSSYKLLTKSTSLMYHTPEQPGDHYTASVWKEPSLQTIVAHPGPSNDSIIAWCPKASGMFTVFGTTAKGNLVPTVTWYIYLNAAGYPNPLFSTAILNTIFNFNVTLVKSDCVYFGTNNNGAYHNDHAGWSASTGMTPISKVGLASGSSCTCGDFSLWPYCCCDFV
jgi:hypothetical protein